MNTTDTPDHARAVYRPRYLQLYNGHYVKHLASHVPLWAYCGHPQRFMTSERPRVPSSRIRTCERCQVAYTAAKCLE